MIAERMPATFELAAAAMMFALAVAMPLGIAAAVWRGTSVDHGAMTLALLGISIPNFWLGPLLAIVFAVELGSRAAAPGHTSCCRRSRSAPRSPPSWRG
jgi:peptide/nickel transport system permease protein